MRTSLIGAGVLAWAFALWLGSHSSSEPQVLGRWSWGYFCVVAAAAVPALLLTVAHAGPIYRRIHAARRRILALLIAVVVSIAALEGLVRLLDPLGISYYEESKRYHLDKIADPDLLYRHRPNTRTTYFGVDYVFNEMGLRERPIGSKAAGDLRVLVLGDSVAVGSGVNVEDAFARLLEDLLAKRTGRPVRTINAGVGSYNTTQEFAFLKLRGEEIAPDLVLLVYVDNDIERNLPPFDPWSVLSIRGKSPPEVVERILWHSWLYRLGAHVVRHRDSAAAPPDRASEGWQESMAKVGEIADLCGQRGIPFALFLWRFRTSPLTDALFEDLSAVAAAKQVPFGDMQEAFRKSEPREIAISPVDVHPNPLGHRLAAAYMDEFLAAHGLPRR